MDTKQMQNMICFQYELEYLWEYINEFKYFWRSFFKGFVIT